VEGLLIAVVRNVSDTLSSYIPQRIDLELAVLVQEFMVVSGLVGWEVDMTNGSIAF
jgi:nitrogen fixation protein